MVNQNEGISSAPTRPTFGIVVPTLNESGNLPRLLESIKRQRGASYVTVIVDQGSSDETTRLARSYGCLVIDVPKPEYYSPPAQSRNVGARSVDCRVLLHLDADMELGSDDFLQKLEGYINPVSEAAIIREVDVRTTGFWARCKSAERSCYFGTRMEGARAVTRNLFTIVGGYDDQISSGEDWYITRLYERHTIVARPESIVLLHNIGRLPLLSLLQKKFAYGRTASLYLRKSALIGVTASTVAKDSFRAYARSWRVVCQDPFAYIGVLPMRAMELTAVRLGMLYGHRRPPTGGR